MDLKTNRRLTLELLEERKQSKLDGDWQNYDACGRALSTLSQIKNSILKGEIEHGKISKENHPAATTKNP